MYLFIHVCMAYIFMAMYIMYISNTELILYENEKWDIKKSYSAFGQSNISLQSSLRDGLGEGMKF